jgi:glycosyltransferase involved in cell wall biosynthesis
MIDILLATYNGEKYLREQLDSIFDQSCQDWKLLVRDDGSSDGTVVIIEDYMSRYPGKVTRICDDKGRLGVCQNFGELLKHSTAEYVMFSDQDDVWLPNKIELMRELMKNAEVVYPDIPLLVHTDKRVVDSDLNVVADSHWSLTRMSPFIGDDVNKLMVDGLVSGNTMIVNRKAKEISIPIPKEATLHDRWISIKTAKYGKILYSSVPCILYRQHSSNSIGSQKRSVMRFVRNMFFSKRQFLVYRRMYRMAKLCDINFSVWKFIKNKTILLLIRFIRGF